MSEELGGATSLSRLRRLPEKGAYDAETIHAILDATSVCHVATVVDGQPIVLPSLHARDGDSLLLHGSRSSRLLRAMVAAESVCVAVTLVDGLVVARSTFESSVAYRSAVVFGPAELLDDPDERSIALDRLIDGLLPGRSAEVRPSTPEELRRTSVVRVRIAEASAKVSVGPPDDGPDDVLGDAWAGVVPLETRWGVPEPAPDGAVGRGEVPVPPSVLNLEGGL
jgi:hypothetical protein